MYTNLFKKFYSPEEIGGETTQTPAESDGVNEETTPEKTFTQEELNRIIAKEKEKAAKSVLKNLGFEDTKTAKAKITELMSLEDESRSDLEKLMQGKEKAEKTLSEKMDKISELETQLSLMQLGVTPTKISEANALIALKLNEDKDMETAIEELKVDFPMLFLGSNNADGNTGTGTGTNGNPPRNPRTVDTFTGIGQRLAEQRLQQEGYNNKE